MNCEALLQSPDDSLVTWQSAFFGILPIAMNSMFQNNGMVLSFPSTWGTALRSSPIFCLFDALDLSLLWLVLIFFGGDHPRIAAKRIARRRFRDATDADNDQSLTNLRQNFWLIQAVFIISTLTQAIKLFACSGMIGTQLCAACYLFSYTISQALVWAADQDWQTCQLDLLDPGPLADIADHGLLNWIPSHILATFFHSYWLDGLIYSWSGDVAYEDIPAGPFYSIAILVIALIAVFPLVLLNSDRTSAPSLSQTQSKFMLAFSILSILLLLAWNSIIRVSLASDLQAHSAGLGPPFTYNMLPAPLIVFQHSVDKRVGAAMIMLPPLAAGILWPGLFILDDLGLLLFVSGNLVSILVEPTTALVKARFPSLADTLPQFWFSKRWARLFSLILAFGPVLWYFFELRESSAGMMLWTSLFAFSLLARADTDLKARNARFSATAAGTVFVATSGFWALLWYAYVWDLGELSCPIKPGWTNVLG